MRLTNRSLLRSVSSAAVLLCVAAPPSRAAEESEDAPETRPRLGEGRHAYRWDGAWPRLDGDLGSTHGGIAFDANGNVYLQTDTARAVMVFSPDGELLRTFGEEWGAGLHGIAVDVEGGREFLWLCHTGLHAVLRATLDGEETLRIGPPDEAGVYDRPEAFRPTGVCVAPDGDLYVADGYGLGYVHRFDRGGRWKATIGGPGAEPGRFRTPHGIGIDRRGDEPTLLVADRENGRLQRFSLDGRHLAVIGEGELRRPCAVAQRGDFLVVPDLAGRVTILGRDDRVVVHLGDQPDPALRAKHAVPRERWRAGEFLSPHGAAWDRHGNLFVVDWNASGRVTRLERER
ncbi:MAG: peptidase [Planctomycetota bacterium JB042]